MSATTVFENHVARVQRLARLRTVSRLVLVTAVVFLCGYTVLAIASRLVRLSFDITPQLYGGLAVGAFVVAVVYVLITRARLLPILIEIDARLKLRDRLSTAYEYQAQGKRSEFLDLLVADAGRRLSNLQRRQLFPFAFSRLHLALLIVILLNVALIGLDELLPEKEAAVPLNPQVSEQLQKTIEEYLKNNEAQQQEPEQEKKTQQELQQKLEQMARQLEQQKMTRKQALEALQQNLKEIQSQQDQLTEELDVELKSLDGIRELPMPSMSQLQELSSQQLSKMQKMFREALGGELPENIQANMEMLRQYQEMDEMLENMEEQLASQGQDKQAPGPEQQQEAGTQGSGEGEQMASEENPEYSDAPPPGDMASDESRTTDQNIDGQRMQGLDGEDSENQPDSPEPGRSPGDGQLNSPSPINRTEEGPQQDRMAPSKKAEYNAHIRSVTTIGEATVPEEDVGRAYEQEVERVLQKEDMPLNYREYIKTYFLSIGLTSED